MKMRKVMGLALVVSCIFSNSIYANDSIPTNTDTEQTAITHIASDEIIVYQNKDYTVTMDKADYNRLSKVEQEKLVTTYEKLLQKSISTFGTSFVEEIDFHKHNYAGPYKEKFSYKSNLIDTSGEIIGYVNHYVCAEPTGIVCPFDKVYGYFY